MQNMVTDFMKRSCWKAADAFHLLSIVMSLTLNPSVASVLTLNCEAPRDGLRPLFDR